MELIISIAIFLLVTGVVTTIFISIIRHQRQVLSDSQFLNQVSYVEEYLSKALRMAKKDSDGSCIPEGYIYLLTRPDTKGFYRGIKFINQSAEDACMEFFLDNAVPDDTGTPLVLKELKNSPDIDDAVPLTPGSFQIESLRFGINGTNGCFGGEICPGGAKQEDGIQPRVTILLAIKISQNPEGPARIIQTTVSQRNLNVE